MIQSSGDLGKGFALLGEPLRHELYFGSGEVVTVRKGETGLKAQLDRAIRRLGDDDGLSDSWQRYFVVPPGQALLSRR